jgi:hypothetical protein
MTLRRTSGARGRSIGTDLHDAEAIEGRWRPEDIGLERVDRTAIVDDPLLFRIVATASFIEAGSDLYARNLAEFFADDAEIRRWLMHSWEPEELQHGVALRAYVLQGWPDFPWEERFRAFLEEYSRTCTVSLLEPTRALELASRCIVEMGTSALYRALHEYAREPVLKRLAGFIYSDEIRHYKTFYRHFRRYQQRERPSRIRIGGTLLRRLVATRSYDGRCAYGHVWDYAPVRSHDSFDASFEAFGRDMTRLLRSHVPCEMLTRMILNPLAVPAPVADAAARFSAPLYRLWLAAGN